MELKSVLKTKDLRAQKRQNQLKKASPGMLGSGDASPVSVTRKTLKIGIENNRLTDAKRRKTTKSGVTNT